MSFSESNLSFYQNKENTCIERPDRDWIIVHQITNNLDINISNYGYVGIPKLFALTDMTSMESSGMIRTINQSVLNTRGQGVIIGFVDSGIDYTLDVFKYSNGQSKIEAIWDQTVNEPNNFTRDSEIMRRLDGRYQYGRIYDNNEINQAIAAKEQGGNPLQLVNSTDTSGHGTFCAGVAAGSRINNEFIGAAPDATIAVVKVKQTKRYLKDFFLLNDDSEAYQETDIMMGISFLMEVAAILQKPMVIFVGMGSNNGSHTNGSPLDNMLSRVADSANTVVVVGTGNEANQRLHYSGVLQQNQEFDTMELNVGENEKGFSMEIWSRSPNTFSVSVVSPSGEEVQRIPARVGVSNIFRFIFDRTILYVDYKIVETLSGDELIFIRFDAPTPGIWQIRMYGLTGIVGEYNAWLPVRDFLDEDTFFVVSSPYTTLTEPSTVPDVISVGAYNHTNGSLAITSGRGYTSDGRIKPDLCAPGVDVYGPRVGGGFVYRSGTSVAAAHVAGASALLLTWGAVNNSAIAFNTVDVKNILIRGANRDANRIYPNREWGFGTLDVYNSFEQMKIT